MLGDRHLPACRELAYVTNIACSFMKMKVMVGQSFFGPQNLVALAAEMEWMPGMLGIIMDLTFPILPEFLLAHRTFFGTWLQWWDGQGRG